MLQQTTVTTVRPYFDAFLERWPKLEDLASACEDEVLTQWQGLGYYSRARNLHKAAQFLVVSHQGNFPQDLKALETIPGVGPYTAAALGAIAFNLPTVPVDGNIARVFARLCRLETPLPDLLTEVRHKIQCLANPQQEKQTTTGQILDVGDQTHDNNQDNDQGFFHHGDLAQALMDLGARLCKPKKPSCEECPIRSYCKGFQAGDMGSFPLRKPKPRKPTKYAMAFYVENQDGALWLQKRPESGLLARMMEVPSTPWQEEETEDKEAGGVILPFSSLTWQPCPQKVKHTFTHFHLVITVWRAVAPHSFPLPAGGWYLPETLQDQALPTLMKKIIEEGRKKKTQE